MEQAELVERINQLARKQRTDGLTEAEKAEQQALRNEYLSSFRRNFVQMLETVIVEEPDGTQRPLQRTERGARR